MPATQRASFEVIEGGQDATVPLGEYEAVHRQLEDMAGELAAARRGHASEHRRAERYRTLAEDRQAKDVEASAKTVTEILRYWARVTGRERYRVVLTGVNAQLVRWLLRSFEPREVCLMALGMAQDQWHVSRGLTDWKFIATTKVDGKRLRDEEKARRFMDAGAVALGGRAA